LVLRKKEMQRRAETKIWIIEDGDGMTFQVRNDPGPFRFLSLGTYVPEQQQDAVTAGAGGSPNMNISVAEWRALIAAQRQERRQLEERAAAQRLAELLRAGTEPVSPAQWRAQLDRRRARALAHR
jgi:hypothetical protein